MKSIIPLIVFFLIITSCTNSKKQLTVRDTAISLIEKEHPANGRKLEYSQIDSADAELKGYFIGRIYISEDDSIRVDQFHLNFAKTKTDTVESFTISSDMYKSLLNDSSIFTNDMRLDFTRIYSRLSGSDIFLDTYNDSILIADSIAAIEALAVEAAVKAGIY